MSGDLADEAFSDGLTDDIIAGLSKFRSLIVIARNSTSQYKGKPIDVREVGTALGAGYVLEGSVRELEGQLRVTTQLLEANNGGHLWSETFDYSLASISILDAQDLITARVVGSLGPVGGPIWLSEIQKLSRSPSVPQDPYDCTLLATQYFGSYNIELHARARNCLENAVKDTPNYAPGWLNLAWMYLEEHTYEINVRPNALDRALAATQRARELDPLHYEVYYLLARIYHAREEKLDTFYAMTDKAIALNPYDSTMIGDLGNWTSYAGEWERGGEMLRRAMQLNPSYPSWIHFPLSLDFCRKGEYREALVELQKADLPQNFMVQGALAAVYAQLGELETAKATLNRVLAIHPEFANDPRDSYVKRRMPDDLVDDLMDGLRKAGLEVPTEPPQDN